MTARVPPQNLNPDSILQTIQQRPDSTTLTFELVTPMYGGGVKAHTVDEAMPIRVSAIRGQLRFWWRLLATQKWMKGQSTEQIRAAEANIWGGIGDKTTASKVFLHIPEHSGFKAEQWATYEKNHKDRLVLTPKKSADVPYVLFPAQGKAEFGQVTEEPHKLAVAGAQFDLQVRFAKGIKPDPKNPGDDPNISPDQEQQVWESIRWWTQFGGLGARTRRGLGAVVLKEVKGQASATLKTVISKEQATEAGCKLLIKKSGNNVFAAWSQAIKKLQSFRQVDVGRKDHSSRSKWPEPDAIRRITGKHLIQDHKKHEPKHEAGDIFPRAAFGMPIIFKFKDDDSRKFKSPNQPEPPQTSLQPKLSGEDKPRDRMASPLILRPFHTGNNQWAAAALLLPHDHLKGLQLKLVAQGPDRDRDAVYWNQAKANVIEPIRQHGGGSPLDAFMNYFAK